MNSPVQEGSPVEIVAWSVVDTREDVRSLARWITRRCDKCGFKREDLDSVVIERWCNECGYLHPVATPRTVQLAGTGSAPKPDLQRTTPASPEELAIDGARYACPPRGARPGRWCDTRAANGFNCICSAGEKIDADRPNATDSPATEPVRPHGDCDFSFGAQLCVKDGVPCKCSPQGEPVTTPEQTRALNAVEDLLALDTSTLQFNPEAARQAMADMGGPNRLPSDPPILFVSTPGNGPSAVDRILDHAASLKRGKPAHSGSLPDDAAARNAIPLADGCLYYFPNALAAVAQVSKAGNDQHNPGEPMHWARGKSTDHANKIMRHLVDAGQRDGKGIRHSAYLAWRALALLQEEIERDEGVPLPRNAWPAEVAK